MQHAHGQEGLVATVCVLVGTAVAYAVTNTISRAANHHRDRAAAMKRLADYTDAEFRRRYRMSRERFQVYSL